MKTQQIFGVLAIFTMMVLVFGSAGAVDEPAVQVESGEEGEEQVDLGPPGVPGQPVLSRATIPTVKVVSGKIENGETITINGYGFGHGGSVATASGNQVSPALRSFALGNAPVFEDCTWHKVQEHLDWSDRIVDLSLDLNLAQEGETIYLFFVEENKVVRPGYELENGNSDNEEGPGRPGKPVAGS